MEKNGTAGIALVLCVLWGMIPACSAGETAGPPPTPPSLGDVCTDAAECATGQCLLQPGSLQGIAGLCTLTCISPTGCGSEGECVSNERFGHLCFRTCYTASDCAPGVPCVYQPPQTSGICQPVPGSLCSDLAGPVAACSACSTTYNNAFESACNACMGTMCCAEAEGCAADVNCGQLIADRNATPPDDSGDPAAAAANALLACLSTRCAAACQ